MLSNVAVSREIISKKESPYSECLNDLDKLDSFDSELFRTIIKTGKKYRRMDCYDLCYQKSAIKECKCQDVTILPLSQSIEFCIDFDKLQCNFQNFVNFCSSDVKQKCSGECPFECESIKYRLSTNYLNYPTESYANILLSDASIRNKFGENNSKISFERLKRNILSVNVFYDELKYVSFQELEKTSTIDLVAGIGGTLGLFIGVSFLSLIEILEILMRVFFVICKKPFSRV